MTADEKIMSGTGVPAHGAYTLGGNFFGNQLDLAPDLPYKSQRFHKLHLKAKVVVGFGESHTNTLRIIIEAQ